MSHNQHGEQYRPSYKKSRPSQRSRRFGRKDPVLRWWLQRVDGIFSDSERITNAVLAAVFVVAGSIIFSLSQAERKREAAYAQFLQRAPSVEYSLSQQSTRERDAFFLQLIKILTNSKELETRQKAFDLLSSYLNEVQKRPDFISQKTLMDGLNELFKDAKENLQDHKHAESGGSSEDFRERYVNRRELIFLILNHPTIQKQIVLELKNASEQTSDRAAPSFEEFKEMLNTWLKNPTDENYQKFYPLFASYLLSKKHNFSHPYSEEQRKEALGVFFEYHSSPNVSLRDCTILYVLLNE